MGLTVYVALLRAVNVGGTGKLSMTTLVEMCQRAGFVRPVTYIASGNAVFLSDQSEAVVRDRLSGELAAYAGKPVGVVVRTAAEMAATLARNPFPDQPSDRVMALFTDGPVPEDALAEARGVADESVRPGARELFIHYPSGSGVSRLKLPAMVVGTARNMRTVAKLAEIAAGHG